MREDHNLHIKTTKGKKEGEKERRGNEREGGREIEKERLREGRRKRIAEKEGLEEGGGREQKSIGREELDCPTSRRILTPRLGAGVTQASTNRTKSSSLWLQVSTL